MPLDDSNSQPVWEASETGIVICPGLSYPEWFEHWEPLRKTDQAINWWIGDALVYAEDNFPEEWTQALDPQYADRHRNALWVSRRIPPGERVEGLSWSVHREVASLDPYERGEVLLLAKERGWGAREVGEERRRRQHKSGPAAQPRVVEHEGANTLSEDVAEMREALDRADAEAGITGNAPVCPYDHRPCQRPRCAVCPIVDEEQVVGDPDVGELMACREVLRKVGNALALSQPDENRRGLPGRIRSALGNRLHVEQEILTNASLALELVPDLWRGAIEIEFGPKAFGMRKITVELTSSKLSIFATGSWLPTVILDAALGAILSDLGAAAPPTRLLPQTATSAER